jgi:hypothetical protein
MQLRFAFGALVFVALGLGACDSNGGVVTPNNPLNPTATPRPVASATVAPTATPTPTAAPASAAPLVCAAPPPDPDTSTVTLTGAAQTISVPCFGTFLSTATVSANHSAGATIALGTSTDQAQGAVPNSNGNYGTPILYTSLTPSQGLSFDSATATIPTVVTSSTIGAPHTYTVQSYIVGLGPLFTSPAFAPVGNSLSFALPTQGGAFPAVHLVVIVYQTT